MELELKKLEDLSEAIVNDFAYMRAREEEMRDTNGRFLFVLFLYSCIFSFIPSFCHCSSSPLIWIIQILQHVSQNKYEAFNRSHIGSMNKKRLSLGTLQNAILLKFSCNHGMKRPVSTK